MKFHGTIEELKAKCEAAGIRGEWSEKPNNCWRLVQRDRAGLNWSENKGTLWFDGPESAKLLLQRSIENALSDGEAPVEVSSETDVAVTVFVVHGHDTTAREQLELVLHRLGLEPYVLQNRDGGGLTIIENLEKMIGRNAESSFGIVLLTPDDMGYAKVEGDQDSKPRARQNVILEMGMLLASLTRPRVAILQKGYVETPSDASGIIYIPFNEHVKECVPKLAERLTKAGFDIPTARVTHASS